MRIQRLDMMTLRRLETQVETQFRAGDLYELRNALDTLHEHVVALFHLANNESRPNECGVIGPTTGDPCALPCGHAGEWHRTHRRVECWPVKGQEVRDE